MNGMPSRHGDYQVCAETPTVDDYLRLRTISGLGPFPREAAIEGLPGGWFAVVVRLGDETVGMGRIIGDGGCFFQVVDIAVDPAHQKRGLGKAIMAVLTTQLEAAAPKGAYVSLIADLPADQLYEHYGFAPTAPRSIGMARRV